MNKNNMALLGFFVMSILFYTLSIYVNQYMLIENKWFKTKPIQDRTILIWKNTDGQWCKSLLTKSKVTDSEIHPLSSGCTSELTDDFIFSK